MATGNILYFNVIIVLCLKDFCTPLKPLDCSWKSCIENTTNPLPRQRQNDPLQCMCDSECVIFGDCCFDYNETTDLRPGGSQVIHHVYPYMACGELHVKSILQYVWLIGKCPPMFPENEVKRKCVLTGSHPLFNIPVTLLSNNLSFVNVFCAQCRQQEELQSSQFTLWKAAMLCNIKLQKVTYSYIVSIFRNACSLNINIPESLKLRYCLHPSVIKTCPQLSTPGLSNRDVSKCLNYQQVVTDGHTHVYKNAHCAACAANMTFNPNITCSEMMNITQIEETHLNVNMAFTQMLKLVFNLDPTGSSLTSEDMVLVPDQRSCDQIDEVYDVSFDVCTKLYCPQGLVLANGSCISLGLYQQDAWHTFHRLYLTMRFDSTSTDFSVDVLSMNTVSGCSINSTDINLFHLTDSPNVGQIAQHTMYVNSIVYSNCSLDILMQSLYESFVTELTHQESRLLNAKLLTNKSCKDIHETITLGELIQRQFTERIYDEEFEVSVYPEQYIAICDSAFRPNCSSVRYSSDKYSLENGTLLLGDSAEPIPESEYILHQNVAYVCRNLSRSHKSFRMSTCLRLIIGSTFADTITGVSILACLLTLIVYIILPQLRNRPGKIVMSLTSTLLFAQFLSVLLTVVTDMVCFVLSAIVHSLWLSVFLWKTVMALDITRTMRITRRIADNNTYSYYVLIAWLTPALTVSVFAFLDKYEYVHFGYGYGLDGVCWILEPHMAVYTMGCPMLVCLVFNTVCFFITLIAVMPRAKLLGNVSHLHRKQQLVKMFIKLSLITGSTWFVMFLADLVDNEWLWYLNVLLNGSSGVYIFVSFVCNARILTALKEKWFLKTRSPSLNIKNNTST